MARRSELAGDKLVRKPDGSFFLTLRQAILLTLKADTAPAKPVQRFVEVLATAVIGQHATDADRVDVFEAWLRGNVKAPDANGTMAMQLLAEGLHESAPELMGLLHTLAAAKRRPNAVE